MLILSLVLRSQGVIDFAEVCITWLDKDVFYADFWKKRLRVPSKLPGNRVGPGIIVNGGGIKALRRRAEVRFVLHKRDIPCAKTRL